MPDLRLTKLHRPPPPPGAVARPYILRQLHAGLDQGRALALVSAPAGFGKTAAVSAWASTLAIPVTWLSLDLLDNDPSRFFAYFVAALQRVDENLGWQIDAVLRAGHLPPAEMVAAALGNDILALEQRFVLVLDDFHVIEEPFILAVLQTLLLHMPPPLHLVLLAREDPALPLARLRAANQVSEIRAADLRLSGREIDRFLHDTMGLSLTPPDAAVLADKTEGWVGGLQLAALAVKAQLAAPGAGDVSSFIAAFSGTHRHILSYLTEEVLARQDEATRRFLLQTSILDKLTGELCDAVTGRTDGAQQLEALVRANLFVIPLDDDQQWYRYHHLFADLLAALRQAHCREETAALHGKAGRWYAQVGMVEDAVRHALAAEEYDLAVRLIEEHALAALMQWRVKTVSRWLQALPLEQRLPSPKLELAAAWTCLFRGEVDAAAVHGERLAKTLTTGEAAAGKAADQDPALAAAWWALQARLLNLRGEAEEGLRCAQRAGELAPEPASESAGFVWSLIELARAEAFQQLGDDIQAMTACRAIMRRGQADGNLVAELAGLSAFGMMALRRGELHLAFELVADAAARIEQSGMLPPISSAIYGELGQVHFHWHQLDAAHTAFRRAVEVSGLSGFSDAAIYYAVVRSRLYEIQGDLAAAAQELQTAADLMRRDPPGIVREEVLAQQVRVCLAQGRLDAAELLLRAGGCSVQDGILVPARLAGPRLDYAAGILGISALRVALYEAEMQEDTALLRQGLELADVLVAGALARGYAPLAVEGLLLRARVHGGLRNPQRSLEDVARALVLGEPEGLVTVFVQEGQPVALALAALLKRRPPPAAPGYIRQILAARTPTNARGGGAQPAGGEKLVEPLTKREQEVLRLMAEGMKYQDIAERLVLSLNTVRFYVKEIYGKLDADNRTRALEAARRHKLL